jgi:peroxiredoxin
MTTMYNLEFFSEKVEVISCVPKLNTTTATITTATYIIIASNYGNTVHAINMEH